jgi:tryptophan-rich sensory protein
MYSNSEWYKNLNKSNLTPPNWVFSVVWSLLYASIAAYYVLMILHPNCDGYCIPLIFFTVQMFFNFLWPYVFFRLEEPLWALLINGIMVILTVVTIYFTVLKHIIYGAIITPYLLWICFAYYLNAYIVKNN